MSIIRESAFARNLITLGLFAVVVALLTFEVMAPAITFGDDHAREVTAPGAAPDDIYGDPIAMP